MLHEVWAYKEHTACITEEFEIPQLAYHKGLSTPKKHHGESMGLHEFFHHSAIISCITFHI